MDRERLRDDASLGVMSAFKTFTITGLHGDGDGGASTTLYAADMAGRNVVIAALTGQFREGRTYTAPLAAGSGPLYNGHQVDYLAAP